MSTKLTLNIQDKELIKAAKSFAKSQDKSLSVLMENMLRGLVSKEFKNDQPEVTVSTKLVGAFVNPKKKSEEHGAKWEYMKEKYNL